MDTIIYWDLLSPTTHTFSCDIDSFSNVAGLGAGQVQ